MLDTSFAIQPGKKTAELAVKNIDIGNVVEQTVLKHGLEMKAENGFVKIKFYNEKTVRVIANFSDNASEETSPAVTFQGEETNVTFNEEDDRFNLSTPELKIIIEKSPLRIKVEDSNGAVLAEETPGGMYTSYNKEVKCVKRLNEDAQFYGFGEKTGHLNKRGEKLVMWNSDVFAPHNPETNALYQSIPFFMVLTGGQTFGVYFDNTFRTLFDLGTDGKTYSFAAEGGQLDYYILSGPTPKEVMEQYTKLTGRMPLPPKWAIGYHQSRYSYESEQEVRRLARLFKEKGIPLDAIYLDIHYMNEYRVFTTDKERFPDLKKLADDLREDGIQLVPIVDPGVKKDPEYGVYAEGVRMDQFCKYIEGDIYFGDVWPGTSAFPDFTEKKVRDWWGELHNFYTEKGIEGIWNDMNEPAVFNETKTMDLNVIHKNDGNPKTHKELHNVYGLRMAEATYNGMKNLLKGKRTFVLTRAGFAGIQRYAAVWTGDNRSFWEHLQMSLPMVMNLGLSGVPLAGPDVGGFAHDSNGELLTRWMQVGAFTPYFRNHSVLGSVRQEPWSFGEKYEEIIKSYIRLRYEWMPQLYTLFAEANATGVPVMRPLLMEYPDDPQTWNISDQFMLGNNVIIAPVMQPGAVCRAVYLPEGDWVDYWTDQPVQGGTHHLASAGIETLPIFIKKGTALALTDAKLSASLPDQRLIIHLYYKEGSFSELEVYDDDGSTFSYEEGCYIKRRFAFEQRNNIVSVSFTDDGSFKPVWNEIELVIHGIEGEVSMKLDGQIKKSFEETAKTIAFRL
ncbi:alpha-glucosidase [Bacillus sp. FJAT-18017]|uniref:glycoside hydrolase family 31 protein n=1 Tax=Bacillus sp. FJAT-18017 TaxID=1705566 RepID=UPI0006ADF9D8|nr:glycoside hydrolase family 31 protein [Bacillus sp. FJAT-18017]ALC91892.1 alpha-glucosidase [Bacillus sp. FJAT-18017]